MSGRNSEKDTKSAEAVQLNEFVFSPSSGELCDAAGNIVTLRSQSTRVLDHLVRHRGRVVTRSALFDAVWPGTAVTDDSLVQCITDIRRALGDKDRRLVRTIPKRGYRLETGAVTGVTPHPDLPTEPSIAVLAFDDHSTAQDTRFLSDAIAEGIIAELSRFPELFVVARNSSFSFRDQPTPVREISTQLGVRYLLEGSQQKSGNRLRVTVQLIDAVRDKHLWSEVYDSDLGDLFDVQDDIVRKVVATVAQRLIRVEGRRVIGGDGQRRLTALCHHLEARLHLERFTPDSNERARLANLAAIRADPSQPYGHAGLAFVHINRSRWGWDSPDGAEALDAARAAARKALELGPDYYESHAAMAYVHLQERDLDQAILRGERAVGLNPNDINSMCDLAEFYGYDGRYDAATALLKRAMRLDPLHPDWMKWNLAWVQWLARQYPEALRTIRAMTALPPMAYRVLAVICESLDQLPEARQAVARLLQHDPGYSIARARDSCQGKYRDPRNLERLLEGLRKAGLPE